MRQFVITTDGNADLPEVYTKENDIKVIPLYYSIDDKVYGGDDTLTPEEFYAKMREGKMPTTMAVNPEVAGKLFKSLTDEGYDVLHIAFSSALSSSYNGAAMAAREICEENPEATVKVVDSLSASLGQGLLVHKLVEMKKAGKSLEETYEWAENHKLNVCHQFTVDDLFHLHRGGRVSKATAIVGTLINVKPVLHVDDEGRLISLNNVRGRKKALNALVDNMAKTIGKYADSNDVIFISHGDCIADAQYVADKVKEKFGIEKFVINMVSPTIGAHSGPGTVALFYMGEKR